MIIQVLIIQIFIEVLKEPHIKKELSILSSKNIPESLVNKNIMVKKYNNILIDF